MPPPPISRNDYALEFYQGPLIGPIRVMGLSGAYAGYAEGIDGALSNAASPAVREPFSYDWFDWDIDVDFSLPGAYGGTDFDNRGPRADPKLVSTLDGFFYLHGGLQAQLGPVGASVTAELFQYALHPNSGVQGVELEYGRYNALVGYALANNQLVLGAGLRVVTLQLKAQGESIATGRSLLTLDGFGPQVGALWKPELLPFRVGVTARAPVESTGSGLFASVPTTDASGVQRAGSLILPSKAVLPWELEAGFAFQLGARPLNPGWIDPHKMEKPVRDRIRRDRERREREDKESLRGLTGPDRLAKEHEFAAREEALRAIEDQRMDAEAARLRDIREARELNWPRERILLVGSVLVTGASSNAVAIEGFTTQTRELVGQSVSLSPRVGLESEPVVNWVHARVGSYLEPSRFEDASSRQHFTFGADVKLFAFSPWGIFGNQVWRASFSMDLAPRYQNFGIGIGAWH